MAAESDRSTIAPPSTVLFVCLHGSAKSLIAAEHLNRLAQARGVAWRAESAGIEPDAEVPGAVIDGLAADGIDVRGYRPRQLTADYGVVSSGVISFGCNLSAMLPPTVLVEQWEDMPLVSEGYDNARDAIVARVNRLLDELQSVVP